MVLVHVEFMGLPPFYPRLGVQRVGFPVANARVEKRLIDEKFLQRVMIPLVLKDGAGKQQGGIEE